MREGYYSIINGYKEPFLEPVVTKDDLSDRYKGGASFDDIFALFTFDCSLQRLDIWQHSAFLQFDENQ